MNDRAEAARGRRAALVAAIVGFTVAVTGCVATTSTIGGLSEAEIQALAARAQDACRQRSGLNPPYPFTTDGCTLSPDCTWQSCCVEHDIVYWCGGTAEERRVADARFRACVGGSGGQRVATFMHWGVRLGGHPWLPAYWRWGYGWPWPRGYTDGRPP